jgi:hypothetical protein
MTSVARCSKNTSAVTSKDNSQRAIQSGEAAVKSTAEHHPYVEGPVP